MKQTSFGTIKQYTATVLVPTYNRPQDLLTCVQSICSQTELPQEVLVIDDGNLEPSVLNAVTRVVEGVGVAFVYYKKDHAVERRGLSESKNIGLRLARNPICFVFDDDVVLEPEYLEASLRVWRTQDGPHLIAVGGIITNARSKSIFEPLYNTCFGLVGDNPWDISRTGFQTWDDSLTQARRGAYTHGGVCSLHVERARQFLFPVFAGGRTALEDVAFYAAAKQKGFYTIIEPRARVAHYHSSVSREGQILMGKKEGANRVVLYRAHLQKGVKENLLFQWSAFGWIVRQFLAGHVAKGVGMAMGHITACLL